MSVFVDSSALVKLYVAEPGSEQVQALSGMVVSQIARVEIPAALWRKHRTGAISAGDARLLVSAFEADYHGTPDEPPRFAVVPVTPIVLDVAARLTGVHGLRAYDAIQLATAQLVASADRECRTFAAFDKALSEAAAGEGFHPVGG
ncbi:type II toxin-antitoxin system VapC family toxin [Amycolatopsis methanolica]|uniref:Ribonuclease VapC n=1 Tax=Amycolatopsis methanolica 239 TaxID=1068978 RepID=A0A076MQ58_AMYME|nr:type II toxin-antitoxin system VapC family toxin [Amycolatopsis methanolica]AIJ21066.1 PilT protein domain protein [Amycolatopsis methanolica 239]